jgi:predicted short-subunit dehydrogenase-like oxidoreductase (DUF2520 family)
VNIAIVGAGKVGTVLGRVLLESGDRIVAVIARTNRSAAAAGGFLKCRTVSTSLAAIPPKTQLVLIATPEDVVAEVAHKLASVAHLQFTSLSVCHVSGLLTAEVLEPLARKGATVFSFHPLQTFPADFTAKEIVPTIRRICFGVDGTREGVRAAERLAMKFKSKVVFIRPEMRALYHAACVVASNHVTTLLWILEQMFSTLKTKEKKFFPMFEPILTTTLQNAGRTSPAKALSGPIARGNLETVSKHLEALQRFAPNLVPYFGSLSAETTRLAEAKGSIDREQARTLYNLILSTMRM